MDGGSDAKKSTGMFCRMNGCDEESDEWAILSPYSGTLSYIFNNFKGTQSFSDVVAEAKEVGFTEPIPRDDLSRTDLARKVIILARESCLKLELSDIQIVNLVPKPIRDITSTEEFMHQLPNFDIDLSKQRDEAEAAGEVLRFVGVVDVAEVKGLVELRRYSNDHPFAQLSGSDNIMASTMRYKDQPLIVVDQAQGQKLQLVEFLKDLLLCKCSVCWSWSWTNDISAIWGT